MLKRPFITKVQVIFIHGLFLLAKCLTFSHICCHSRFLSDNRWHSQITSGLSVSDRVSRNKNSAACLSDPLNFQAQMLPQVRHKTFENKDVSSYFNVVLFWHGWCSSNHRCPHTTERLNFSLFNSASIIFMLGDNGMLLENVFTICRR